MRFSVLLLGVIVLLLGTTGPAAGSDGDELKIKVFLVPCGEHAGTDAGGEVEDEADSGLTIEVWDIRGLAGESLVLLVDGEAVARFTVDGFEDGRFYAQGFHISGEMGGIWTEDGRPVLCIRER